MRIGYVLADSGVPVFGTKGASVHVRELIRALGAERTVDLFCATLGDGHGDLPIRDLHVVPRPVLPEMGDPDLERDRRRLAYVERMKDLVDRACRGSGYDMLYERYSLYSDVGAAVSGAHDLPFLLEVNAPLIVERRSVEALPLASLAHEIESSVFRRADAVLAVSETMAAYAVGVGARVDRVHVVPNGVDASRFHPGVGGDQIRAALRIQAGLVVGFAGSLKPWHGVDLLLAAFARTATRSWTLLVVGDGPERDRLERQAGALEVSDRVVFTGAVRHDEMPAYVAAMDIAVAPYRSSADFYFSPLKLFEYLAAGKAVIASDLGQIATAIRHGENGYLVAPDDVLELSRALARLAVDASLRRDLARRAPEGLVSWQDTAQRVIAIAEQAQRARTVGASLMGAP